MRISIAAIYCLAFLAGQSLTQQAEASPLPQASPDSLEQDDVTGSSEQTVVPTASAVVAASTPEESFIGFQELTVFESALVTPRTRVTSESPLLTASTLTKVPVGVTSKPLALSSLSILGLGSDLAVAGQSPAGSGHMAQALMPDLTAQAQPLPNNPTIEVPDPTLFDGTQTDLDNIDELVDVGNPADFSSPGLTIANPSGYGVDQGTFFISGTFQARTRYSNQADGALAFGVGLFDARRFVGAEVSYTLASFGGSRSFGTGGFNLKVHRLISDSFSLAVGWNGFLGTGDSIDDFSDSVYGSMTKIFRLRDDVNQPFSRIALTAGAGTGQFRLEEDVDNGNSTVNPYGSVAVRVVEPVSFITEWTGQDLALGFSITPFQDFNFTITPAVRDIVGAGDGARFVLGFGTSF
jgi:hypothetical protein